MQRLQQYTNQNSTSYSDRIWADQAYKESFCQRDFNINLISVDKTVLNKQQTRNGKWSVPILPSYDVVLAL